MRRERGAPLPEPVRVSGKGIHMPNPSFWPLVTALGVLVTLSGFVAGFPYVNLVGAAILLTGIFSWAFEPAG
jgi:cytochrome c oxidase subunit 1